MSGVGGNFAPTVAIQQAIHHRGLYPAPKLFLQCHLQRRDDNQLTLLGLGFPGRQKSLLLFQFH